MSKFGLACAFSFVALTAMGASSYFQQNHGMGQGIDPIITTGVPQLIERTDVLERADGAGYASLPGGEMFILTGEMTDEICIFERSPLDGRKGAKVQIDSDCAPLYPDLVRVKHWREQPDGRIDLVDEKGGTVARFTNTDGSSFITLIPSAVHLTFSPI